MATKAFNPSILMHGHTFLRYPKELRLLSLELAEAWKGVYLQKHVSDLHKKFPLTPQGGVEQDPDRADEKITFHITPDYPWGDKQQMPDVTKKELLFFLKASDMIEAMDPMIRDFIIRMENASGINLQKYFQDIRPTIRTLHYWKTSNEILAVPHIDKGPATIHLYDSLPGLECFWGGKWKSMHFDDKHAAAFPGAIVQYYTKCMIKALWHRVISSPESRKVGRDSIVLFLDSKAENRIVYNKHGNGPAQKAFGKPGDTYIWSFKKYGTLFEKYDPKREHLHL